MRAPVVEVGAAESLGQVSLLSLPAQPCQATKIEGPRHQPLGGAGREAFEAGTSLGGKAEGNQFVNIHPAAAVALGFLFPWQAEASPA